MSSTFTPSDAIDMSNEKTWPHSVGLLDWDSTNIKKGTLLNVGHRYTGTTVDPNFSTIAKLPRYAKFGKLTSEAPNTPGTKVADENATTEGTSASGNEYGPSRRVRAAQGNVHTDIFGHDDDDDALASAPPKHVDTDNQTQDTTDSQVTGSAETQASGFRPSRRVRTIPGGKDSIGSILSSEELEEFKPTRRVREAPGGRDSLSDFW